MAAAEEVLLSIREPDPEQILIERDFDIPFIADLALREKQIQQNYRPIIAVHKWFARRPGTLFRGLLLSEFGEAPLRKAFYQSNQLNGLCVADPFMGGGIPLLEANRLGADVFGVDINPMAYWVVKEEVERLELQRYRASAAKLRETLNKKLGHLYETRCLRCDNQVPVKYFLWVKVKHCPNCGKAVDLFPTYLIAKNKRHPNNVVTCGSCAELNEVRDLSRNGTCKKCGAHLTNAGPARRSRCRCADCQSSFSFGQSESTPLEHRMFAIEYHCFQCKPIHTGRFFKKPDADDLARFREAQKRWDQLQPKFAPDDEIPKGDETNRLHRWGYRYYREMFNSRQLFSLESACRLIHAEPNERIRNALATNLSDLLRYQNMLCRYDTMALKSLDIFSVHGFPVGLVQCESNFLGIEKNQSSVIGSGGWSNIVNKFFRAKAYCESPFEVRHERSRKTTIPITGEWIGDVAVGTHAGKSRSVVLHCGDAAAIDLRTVSFDAVITDPPYFANVQYAELMDFCYVWLRRLVPNLSQFSSQSTRSVNELTVNANMGRGLESFTEGLSAGFSKFARHLKEGAPFVFTYHHNKLDAYYPIAVAILDSGLTCSGSLPSPAEMSASIHINGTGSSIIDTVFVCRKTGKVPAKWIVNDAGGIASLVHADLNKLKAGNVRITQGDVRCIIFGHLIRLAVWWLRGVWDDSWPVSRRIAAVASWISVIGGSIAVERQLKDMLDAVPRVRSSEINDPDVAYDPEISF